MSKKSNSTNNNIITNKLWHWNKNSTSINYCKLLRDILAENNLDEVFFPYISKLCEEFNFLNEVFNELYEITTNNQLNKRQQIAAIIAIQNDDGDEIFDRAAAYEIYDKMQELNPKVQPLWEQSDAENIDAIEMQEMGGGAVPQNPNKAKTAGKQSSKNAPDKPTLYPFQEKFLKEKLDMIEIMLISMSVMPITGWMWDFWIICYALIYGKYRLAITTCLSWYIWSFWALFGMYVNMGPNLKLWYLSDNSQKLKKVLEDPELDKYDLDPYIKTRVRVIDGFPYLVDEENNVYSAIIENDGKIGNINPEGKFVKTEDVEEYEGVKPES